MAALGASVSSDQLARRLTSEANRQQSVAHQLPVICLSGDHYNHPDHGRVETPLLDIVRWVDPPKNIKQIRPPKTASSTLVIEQKRDEASDKGFGSDFGADFDDEFPLSE